MAAADDDALSTCSPYFRRGEGNRSKGLRCFSHSLLVAMEEERRRRTGTGWVACSLRRFVRRGFYFFVSVFYLAVFIDRLFLRFA
jgi:hypothetical protein